MLDYVEVYGYLWNRSDPSWVLLKSPLGGYCVFNKQGSILVIEDDEISDLVCKRMKDAGCEILETLPELGLAVPIPIVKPTAQS